MINEIVVAISKALYNEFGEEYKIYAENVEQGLERPCFFIQCISPKIKRFRGNRFYFASQFVAQYFPSSTTDYRAENLDMTERLFDALEFIDTDDGKIMGSDIDSNTNSDGVLSFFINYNLFGVKEQAETSMKNIECNIRRS